MKTNGQYGEYETDISAFTRERPLGVTGILRCRNGADYLEACIDSCIDALDELVIVYHDCTDDTPQILESKQKQYPDKIKIYEYQPYVLPMEMDCTLFPFAKSLPSDSIHLLSGYYNYALSKVGYRYVVKVDADQIYFPQIWKRLCDAYRSTAKVQPGILEYIAYGLYHAHLKCFSNEDIHHCGMLENIAARFHRFYFSYIEKRIIRDKVAVSLSGINLFRKNDRWEIGLGDRQIPELFPPFNGVRDHFFFELSEQTYYEKKVMATTTPGKQRIIEMMYYSKEILDGGFLWFHVKPMMPEEREKCGKMYEEHSDRFTTLDELKKHTYHAFRKRHHPFIAVRFAEPIFSYFYTSMRKAIPWKRLKNLERLYDISINDEHKRRMNMRDYYLEFHEELDRRLMNFVTEQEQKDARRMSLGTYDIKTPLTTLLFYQLTHEKEHYNECRNKGLSIDEAMKRVDAFLDMFRDIVPEDKKKATIDIRQHPWYESLLDYQGQLIIYLFNPRQLHYLTPLINRLNRPILLLSEYELPDETDLPDYVTALTIEPSDERAFDNPYLEYCFPFLYRYANLFSFLIRILQPSGIICLEGCHVQEQLLAVIAEDCGIPSIGIQQGWPSFMRTGFRRLPFRYFLTWGEHFSKLWKRYNENTEFLPMGYMYDVPDTDVKMKDSVTFFLQAPCFLSDSRYFNEILELITDSAKRHPDIPFLVREHPEYKLEANFIKDLEAYPNIQIASDWELKEVYRHTLITVSHFSSSLMEGVVHDCIPLVYDPTTDSRYYPDVEKEGLGKIAKTEEEFQSHLKEMLDDIKNGAEKEENRYSQKIKEEKQQWFAATGEETLKKMADFIPM